MDVIERHYLLTHHTVLTDELWADLRKLLPAYEVKDFGKGVIIDHPRHQVSLALDSLRLRATFRAAGPELKQKAKQAAKEINTLRETAQIANRHGCIDEVAMALDPIIDPLVSMAQTPAIFSDHLHKNSARSLRRAIKEAAQAYALAAGVKLAELSPGSRDAPSGNKGPVFVFVIAVLKAGGYEPDPDKAHSEKTWDGVWVHLNKAIKESRQQEAA